jgi:hypothetical protein
LARIHVAYQHSDEALVRKFVVALRERHHHVTVDYDYVVLGLEWRRALHEAFTAADALVVLLTPNSVNAATQHISSQFIAADIGAARAAGKVVLPILLDGTPLPLLISDIQSQWMKSTTARDIGRMIEVIERGLERHAEERRQLETFPLLPGYEHLAGAIRRFHEDGPYEKSVFVMMKFPDAHMKDVQRELLDDIWTVVSETLEQRGLKARRADRVHYHDDLWTNICVHMFGSKYGLAILEDRAARELNPNVTLEYGFMKAINRTVGLFRAQNFAHDRADLTGKLSKSFTIDAKDRLRKASLQQAIDDWLTGLPLRRSRKPAGRAAGERSRRRRP